MLRKEGLDKVWESFDKHVDENMPGRGAYCPFCLCHLAITFDNFGRVFFCCDCSEYETFELEFQLNNAGYFSGE